MDSRTGMMTNDEIKKECTLGMAEDISGRWFQLYDPDKIISLARNEDLPRANYLSRYSKLCGYLSPAGEYLECPSCTHQEHIREFLWSREDLREEYYKIPVDFFLQLPRGMLQEEYFLMKKLGWVKISSFKNAPHQMVVFMYQTLTPKQTEIIYPL